MEGMLVYCNPYRLNETDGGERFLVLAGRTIV
jgi:hypothetical protein